MAIQSSKRRIRKDFAPLNIAVSLVCTTPASPATQVFNAEENQYEPDRTLTPTVIYPKVEAKSNDGSWVDGSANSLLGNMQWLVDGVDIATITSWQGLYTVDTSDGPTRGAITILRNLLPSEQTALRFRGSIADTRIGANVSLETEDMILTTVEKADDNYSLSLGNDTAVLYNPFKDKLHLYNYKVAHGLVAASADAEAAARDNNAYLQTFPLTLYKGGKQITEGYTIRLYRLSATSTLTELQGDEDEIDAFTATAITIDTRLVERGSYLVAAYVGDREVARQQFSVGRAYPKFRAEPSNGTSIAPTDRIRRDRALVSCGGQVVECPESVVRMVWKTDTAAKSNMTHNEGATTEFDIAATGLGTTYADDWMDTYLEVEQKGAFAEAQDESGNTLTDEEGTTFIFN